MTALEKTTCADCGRRKITTLVLRVSAGHFGITGVCAGCQKNFVRNSISKTSGVLRLPIPPAYIRLARTTPES